MGLPVLYQDNKERAVVLRFRLTSHFTEMQTKQYSIDLQKNGMQSLSEISTQRVQYKPLIFIVSASHLSHFCHACSASVIAHVNVIVCVRHSVYMKKCTWLNNVASRRPFGTAAQLGHGTLARGPSRESCPRALPPSATAVELSAAVMAGIALDSDAATRASLWIGCALATLSHSLHGHQAPASTIGAGPPLSQPPLGLCLAECTLRFLQ
jgi:hypothetical protein